MIESLIAITLIVIAYRQASSSQARTGQQALDATWAWLVGFAAFLVIIIFIVPWAWRYVRVYVPSQYAPILSDVSGGVSALRPPSVPQSLPPLSHPAPQPQPTITTTDPPALLPETGGGVPDTHQGEVITLSNDVQYTVTRGDNLQKIADRYGVTIGDIAAANHLASPDKIVEGQVLVIPQSIQVTATPAPTPVPTATPLPAQPEAVPAETGLDQAFVEIGGYRLNGDMDSAETALNSILATHPGNESATRILEEIAFSKQLESFWLGLDREGEGFRMVNPATELFYNEDQSAYVDGLLSGYEFEIVEYEDFLARTTNAEVMTVRCITPGWMFGTEFTIQAVHATRHGAGKVGDTFEVKER